jgi:hypothetical protein
VPETASAAVAAATAAVEPGVRTAPVPEPSGAAAGTPADAAPRTTGRADAAEPIDLLSSAGPAVVKRAAPALGALVLVLLVIRLIRRR